MPLSGRHGRVASQLFAVETRFRKDDVLSSINGFSVRYTDLPSSTPLLGDFLYNFERVASYYAHPPQLSAVSLAANSVQIEPKHRQALVESLREQNAAAGPVTVAHLDMLRRNETVVVVAGQQVGLFGGPVFTVFKALTAIRLAEQLRADGLSAVPVFWLATEDHDLDEINHAWVLDGQKQPAILRGSAQMSSSKQPVGGVEIEGSALDALGAALANAPFAQEVLNLAASTYREGASFGSGFASLFRELFDCYGLILVDPMDSAIRRVAAPLFADAIKRNSELDTALIERGHVLESNGYHAQVQVDDEMALVFLIDQNQRQVLRRTNAGYSDGSNFYTVSELLGRLKEHPEGFSPNALLRPVVQDFILPTVAYVAGPTELCYLAQAEVLYTRLLGSMPVVLPRASFTLLDSDGNDFLQQHGLSVTDCFEGSEALRKRLGEKLIPSTVNDAFRKSEAEIESSISDIDEALTAFDSTLGAALGTARGKMLYQLEKIRGKAVRESLRRNSDVRQKLETLSNLVYPNKTHQERVYSVLSFLAHNGPDVIEQLYRAINPGCPDHQVLVF